MADEPESSGPPPRDPVRFETWLDRTIREATERGQFDNLPGAGKPLNLPSRRDENWWLKGLIERENLGDAALPTSLRLRKERDGLQDTLADVTTEERAREIVEELNVRIRASHRDRVDGPPIFTAAVNVDKAIAEWRRRRAAR